MKKLLLIVVVLLSIVLINSSSIGKQKKEYIIPSIFINTEQEVVENEQCEFDGALIIIKETVNK